MNDPAPLLEFSGVQCRRTDGFCLNIETFRLQTRAMMSVVGPSGSGKSTCLDLLAMALRPETAHRIAIAPGGGPAVDVARLWRKNDRGRIRALRARHFGYVLQTGCLVPFLSLQENAMLSRRLLAMPGDGPVGALFESLGIAHLKRRKPRNVSIGERQRAAVVRALAHEPAIVLADEPTASLDRVTANDVMKLLTSVVDQQGATLVLVTHDEALASDFGLPITRCRPDARGRGSTIETESP